MKWINSTDLKNWAGSRDCQETLPLLIRLLVRATSKSVQSIRFPAGDNIALHGWDGKLEVIEKTEYLPEGLSLWEISDNGDPEAKANLDYAKRSKNSLGSDPKSCTYVVVTSRIWSKNNDWITEKLAEGIWKDIKIIDAETLEEWIDQAPSVSAWLSVMHFGHFPAEGVRPAEHFWREWSSGKSINLTSKIVLGGRANYITKLHHELLQPVLTAVQSTSREESLAFIVTCFLNSDQHENFNSRSIIIENIDSFRRIANGSRPLILIPLFEDESVFNHANSRGHKVIVPLGPDFPSNYSSVITLPQLEREPFIEALCETGISKQLAETYSKESARNITILRRQLEFERTIPKWATPEYVRQIIPALMIGRWNESIEGDKATIALLANEPYGDYVKKLQPWLFNSDSPVVKIGNAWRLISPLDMWSNASKYLTKGDFESLQTCASNILLEIDPALDLDPENRYMAPVLGKARQYSHWIREGISQSLILVSFFGNRLGLASPQSAELWIDSIIARILDSADKSHWKSLNDLLPLLGEASPSAFLNIVEKHLSTAESPILSLFDEDPGLISHRSYHTGLLWALEGIAWQPEFLARAASILARLSTLAPEVKITNRPIKSLNEIFKPWHPQTFATFQQRTEVLSLIARTESVAAWNLLIHLLPENHESAFQTHQLRWKSAEYNKDLLKPLTYQEIWNTHSRILDLLFEVFDNSESKAAALIRKSVNLMPSERNKIFEFMRNASVRIQNSHNQIWRELREVLSQHRSFPTAEWAFNEEALAPYESLYELFEPQDQISRITWLFDSEHGPNFPEGFDHEKQTYEQHDEIIRQRRISGLQTILESEGIEQVKVLSGVLKDAFAFGDTLAYVLDDDNSILEICDLLNKDGQALQFIQAFINRKSFQKSFEWSINFFNKLLGQGYSNVSLARFLVPLKQSSKLWEFIDTINVEVKQLYWDSTRAWFIHEPPETVVKGIQELNEVKRFISAIQIFVHTIEKIPTKLLIETLTKAATVKGNEPNRLSGYEIERIFEALDKRDDAEENDLIKLEWLYLPLLASYGSRRKPKRLHDGLALNPDFFLEVMCWVRRDERNDVLEEVSTAEQEERGGKASQAFQLLDSWKTIPGVSPNGAINRGFLFKWVSTVREKAIEVGRSKAVDRAIGRVLAQYPEGVGTWPPDEICEVLDLINSESAQWEFYAATSNKRGSSVRGPYDGGTIERNHAEYFRKLANERRNKFIIIVRVLDELVKAFEYRAKEMDQHAERDKLEH